MTSWYVAGRQLAIEASLKEKGERESLFWGWSIVQSLFASAQEETSGWVKRID